MRRNLQAARKAKGMTQQQVSDYLHIGLRHYKYIESGEVIGNVGLWDMLEDLFNVHQRVLRENDPGKADNQAKHPEYLRFAPESRD